MLLSILECTGQPLPQRILRPQMLTVQRERNPELDKAIKRHYTIYMEVICDFRSCINV